MDTEAFIDAVRDDQQTELSRLGSSKSLYAATEGEMEPDAVLAAVADTFHHAAETFGEWAGGDDQFAEAADRAGEHYGVVAGELDGHDPGAPSAVQEHLRDLEGPVERAAGYLGWALVTEKTVGQAVGFFVGQAAPGTADTFRDLRDAVGEDVDAAVAALAQRCDDADDEERAHDVTVATVQAAYDEYTETLESMGVNPKPVC